MIVEIIGKQHREGVSKKTGNSYNFNVVYYIGTDRGVIGSRGLEILLESDRFPLDDIQVGARYDIQFGPRGAVVNFSKVK